MKKILIFVALSTLTACGAAGEYITPDITREAEAICKMNGGLKFVHIHRLPLLAEGQRHQWEMEAFCNNNVHYETTIYRNKNSMF